MSETDATLVLRFDAPMQSWGLRSHWAKRDTATEPTKSGVVGLLAAAKGVARDDDEVIAALAELRLGIRVDREPTVERDYHTVQNVRSADGSNLSGIESYRFHLADALFLACLSGKRETLWELHHALLHPVWPLYFGRRAFLPAGPLTARAEDALFDEDVDTVLRSHPWLERRPGVKTRAEQAHQAGRPVTLRTLVDVEVTHQKAETRHDHPVSFRSRERRHAPRAVLPCRVPVGPEMLRPDPADLMETKR